MLFNNIFNTISKTNKKNFSNAFLTKYLKLQNRIYNNALLPNNPRNELKKDHHYENKSISAINSLEKTMINNFTTNNATNKSINNIFINKHLIHPNKDHQLQKYKNILIEWFTKNQRLPNGRERTSLMKQIPLNRRNFNILLLRLWDARNKGMITNEIRDKVNTWLLKFKSPPSKDDKIQFANSLKISLRQLQSQIYYNQDKFKNNFPICNKSKLVIQSWIEEHGRKPNEKELVELKQITNLSSSQLHQLVINYLEKIESQNVDLNKGNQIIRMWLMKNEFKNPSKVERNLIQMETNFPRRLLNKRINYFLKQYSNKIENSNSI